eukprot:3087476-Rhodomonas_salina.1
MALRVCYAVSGTEVEYGASSVLCGVRYRHRLCGYQAQCSGESGVASPPISLCVCLMDVRYCPSWYPPSY